MVDAERRILLDHALQRRGKLHLVLAFGSGSPPAAAPPAARPGKAAARPSRPWRRACRRFAPGRACRGRPSRRRPPLRAWSTSGPPSERCRTPFRRRRARSEAPSPSSTLPPSTRATDSLPAWLVWIVFKTCTSGFVASAMPRRFRVSSTFGASWRSAFRSRRMPLPFSAEPISTGTICPARSSATRSGKPCRAAAGYPPGAAPSARRRGPQASRAW